MFGLNLTVVSPFWTWSCPSPWSRIRTSESDIESGRRSWRSVDWWQQYRHRFYRGPKSASFSFISRILFRTIPWCCSHLWIWSVISQQVQCWLIFRGTENKSLYPFASDMEWELASFLMRSGMSTATIDTFFSLWFVCIGLLFFFFPDSAILIVSD